MASDNGDHGDRSRAVRAAVLKADGTNCEEETRHALELAGAAAEVVPMNRLRAGEVALADFDLLVVPGGFSYGDDVASGKVMAVELMSFLADELQRFVADGKPVVGVCNGFQVLVRTGLLPFGQLGQVEATLTDNVKGRYECRWVHLRPEGGSPLARGLPDALELPVAHAEGRFWADEDTLRRIEDAGLVALRYVDPSGRPAEDYPDNPAGSARAIAGVADPSGRVLGLMPHPERFVARHQHPDWPRRPADETPHGLTFFRQLVALAAERLESGTPEAAQAHPNGG